MKKIEKVVVVEGRDDTANLRRFYELDTYETGGSGIDETDLERLKVLQEKRGLIVFTDPDFQGERIRKIIMRTIPEAEHIFLKRGEALPKGKGSLGVEHANFEALEKAFSSLKQIRKNDRPDEIGSADLIRLRLLLHQDSRARREHLCERLRIGYANGKQLAKRLKMFEISLEEVEEMMKDYEHER